MRSAKIDDLQAEIESIEREESPAYQGTVLGLAICRVMRETRLNGPKLGALLGLTKTSFHRYARGTRCKPIMADYLWTRLAEILERYSLKGAL